MDAQNSITTSQKNSTQDLLKSSIRKISQYEALMEASDRELEIAVQMLENRARRRKQEENQTSK